MKKMFNRIRPTVLSAGGIILMSFLFSACLKSDDNANNNTPLSALMGFNLAPDKEAIGITVSGNNLTASPLGYTSYTGTYLNIFPGSREVASYDKNSSSPFTTVTQNFEQNKYYSVFTLGVNGTYHNVVVKDELDSLSATTGQAYVRYINAIPDSGKPVVAITLNGSNISNSNASFGSVSNFTGITPGDISIKVSNGTNISATRTITLEKGKVYTILLVGVPGSADPAKMVQIRFIANGAVS